MSDLNKISTNSIRNSTLTSQNAESPQRDQQEALFSTNLQIFFLYAAFLKPYSGLRWTCRFGVVGEAKLKHVTVDTMAWWSSRCSADLTDGSSWRSTPVPLSCREPPRTFVLGSGWADRARLSCTAESWTHEHTGGEEVGPCRASQRETLGAEKHQTGPLPRSEQTWNRLKTFLRIRGKMFRNLEVLWTHQRRWKSEISGQKLNWRWKDGRLRWLRSRPSHHHHHVSPNDSLFRKRWDPESPFR